MTSGTGSSEPPLADGSDDEGQGGAEQGNRRGGAVLRDGRVLGLVGAGVVAGFLIGLLIFGESWHLPPAWGDIPTWITGIGTVLLVAFAVITAYYARQAFRKQSQEVSDQAKMLAVQSEQLSEQRKINVEQTKVLALQASELDESLKERKREAEQRRRAQASRVFFKADWYPVEEDKIGVRVQVVNSSDQPVYIASLSWHPGSDELSEPRLLSTIRPEAQRDPTDSSIYLWHLPSGTDMTSSEAVLTFRDASGIIWTRTSGVVLTELAPEEVENSRGAGL